MDDVSWNQVMDFYWDNIIDCVIFPYSLGNAEGGLEVVEGVDWGFRRESVECYVLVLYWLDGDRNGVDGTGYWGWKIRTVVEKWRGVVRCF